MTASHTPPSPRNLAEEIGKRRPFDALEQEVFLNLVRTHESLETGFCQLFRKHGLTQAQYNVLRIVRGHEPDGIPSQRIAAEMVTREPDITRLLDRLERAGLARRERSTKDRRVVSVNITAAGRDLLARLDQPVLELHRTQLGHLGRDKLAALNQLLFEARQSARR
jgi:DNA-binding MarR family transcriptional regulator